MYSYNIIKQSPLNNNSDVISGKYSEIFHTDIYLKRKPAL